MNNQHHIVWEDWLSKRNIALKQELDFYTQLLCDVDLKVYPRMSYGVPFLYRLGPIGYFNTDKKGLYFGFYWGKLLIHEPGAEIFHLDDRKMVKLVFLEGKMHNEEFLGNLLSLLDTALKIDQEKYSK
jgi:hypothetical protein